MTYLLIFWALIGGQATPMSVACGDPFLCIHKITDHKLILTAEMRMYQIDGEYVIELGKMQNIKVVDREVLSGEVVLSDGSLMKLTPNPDFEGDIYNGEVKHDRIQIERTDDTDQVTE